MITGVVTSCNRHDLLQRTLDSFNRFADLNLQETIIIEDSGAARPDWLQQGAFPRLGLVKWISNGCSRGQVYSIDTAYEQVTTEYIFHMEDDWEFIGGGFLCQSTEILEKHPEIFQVLLGHYNGHPVERLPQYGFDTKTLNWREGWSGFSWNPGLRRKSEWDRIGSYGRHVGYASNGLGPELALSSLHCKLGFRVGCLGAVCVQHIGNSRSVARQPHKQPERTLIVIPACHSYKYDSWQSDIHVDGVSQLDRLTACRQTWLRDVAPHSDYLDYKFFYGEGWDRDPAADEVFLGVSDEYKFLPAKVYAAFRWAAENGYSRVYKADDDTYAWVDRIARDFLSPEWENEPYYGFKHDHAYITGGAGYVVNKQAFSIVSQVRPTDIDFWAEDIMTYRLLDKANIHGKYHPGHQPGHQEHWFDTFRIDSAGRYQLVKNMPSTCQQFPSVSLRAIHAVQPEKMRELYSRWAPVNV